MENSFGILALLAVTVGVLLTLRHFAAPEVSLAVRLQLALSWTLSLSILALVPADIAATASGDASARPTLALLWDLSYWITFNLTWFVLPLHQIYEDAGDFTVAARLATSVRENVIFYAVLVAVALLEEAHLAALDHRDRALERPCRTHHDARNRRVSVRATRAMVRLAARPLPLTPSLASARVRPRR